MGPANFHFLDFQGAAAAADIEIYQIVFCVLGMHDKQKQGISPHGVYSILREIDRNIISGTKSAMKKKSRIKK